VEIVNVTYSGQGKSLQDYSIKDDTLISSNFINMSFGDPNDRIEVYIYSIDGELLSTTYNFTDYTPYQTINPVTGKFDKILIDPAENSKNLGFDRGAYNIEYQFHKNLFNSSEFNRYFIKEISPSRTELKLSSQTINESSIEAGFDQYEAYISLKNYYPDFYLNFGNNEHLIALNASTLIDDTGTYLLIKLYEPLPFDYDVKTQLWIFDQIAESVSYDIDIQVPAEVIDNRNFLRGPNYNVTTTEKNGQTTPYYTFASLLSSPITSSYRQLASYYQDKAIKINVDYTNFENFIHFSSATERINNFTYKMTLIENYTAQIAAQTSIVGNSLVKSTAITNLQTAISNIIENFDIYEYYLYYSAEPFAWPKVVSTGSVLNYSISIPDRSYVNVSVTSSLAVNWLGSASTLPSVSGVSILYSASFYDDTNKDILRGSIPQYIGDDPNNQPYVTFIDMLGQHFDNIWVYYKDVTNRYNATNDPNTGISIDMVSDALKGLGMQLYTNTNVSNNVYYDLFGYNYDGSLLPPTGSERITTYVTSSLATVGSKDLQQEIYKRVYHNLPYLLKTKGTQRSIKALISIYGIPENILTVNEFGGYERTLLAGVDAINNNKVVGYTSSALISSSLLSPYTTLQYYDTNKRRNSTNIEVGFSIADILDRNITSSLGTFNIDQLIGNPKDQYSSSYAPLVSQSNAYFSSYTYPHSVWEYIRLIKYFNNSIFKTIKDFVPARANLSTGIIVKSHILERNKYARHEPSMSIDIMSQSIDILTLSGEPGNIISGSTEWNTNLSTLVGIIPFTSSYGVEKLTGEFGGTELVITNGDELSQSENSNDTLGSIGPLSVNRGALFQNVTSSVRSKKYFDLDYTSNQLIPVNLGIITQSINNSVTDNYNTYNNPNSPYAYIQDYNYATRHFTDPRYYGSNVQSANYNVYTSGDSSFGKTAAIDKIKNSFAYLVDIYSSSLYMPNRSNAQIKYLIDGNQNITDLTKANNNIFQVQNFFKSGETINISLFNYDEINPNSQKLVNNSNLKIYEGGFRYLPILHNLSGSSSPNQIFELDNPIEITVAGSPGGGPSIPSDSPYLNPGNYVGSYWVEEINNGSPSFTSNFRFFISASYNAPGSPPPTDVTLKFEAKLIIDNVSKNGYCAIDPYLSYVTILSGQTQGENYDLGSDIFLTDAPPVGFSGKSGPAGANWPLDVYPYCNIGLVQITAGTPSVDPVPGYSFYTSFVTSSQNCLYYLTQSNQFVVDRAVSNYVVSSLEPVFQSTSDGPWPASKLEKVVLPLSFNIGDRISLTTSSLGWDEKYEYTVKTVSLTGSGNNLSYLLEMDPLVNLALLTSSLSIDPITGANVRSCRYIYWKHVADETNIMLRYNPKDSSIIEEGLLFPQYISTTVKEDSGNIIKSLRAQNSLPPFPFVNSLP
jgi:hypothetical protein